MLDVDEGAENPRKVSQSGGEPREGFKDIPTGVRAHLEHLLLYAVEKHENPQRIARARCRSGAY